MKKEEISKGMEVCWRCGMGALFSGRVVGIEEKENLVIVELYGGSRRWVRAEDLSRRS